MPITTSRANVKIAGISSWKLKDEGKTEWIPLPFLREGKIEEATLFTKDAFGREYPYAIEIKAEAKMFATGSLANLIQVLDSLGSLNLDHQITARNGITWDSSLLTDKFFGFTWEFTSDKDRDGDRYLKVSADRIIKLAELDTVHGAPSASVADPTSALLPLKNIVRADVVPAGINLLEYSADTSYDGEFPLIKDGKFIAKTVGERDSFGRTINYAIDVNFEVTSMQASSTELGLLDGIAGQENNYRITFADSRICTLASKLGINLTHSIDGDSDKTSTVKYMGSGKLQLSEWDALWT